MLEVRLRSNFARRRGMLQSMLRPQWRSEQTNSLATTEPGGPCRLRTTRQKTETAESISNAPTETARGSLRGIDGGLNSGRSVSTNTVSTNTVIVAPPLAREDDAPNFRITTPKPNAVVPGAVIEISGLDADPTGTLEIEVLTNQWYLQDGKVRINTDRTWTFSLFIYLGRANKQPYVAGDDRQDGQRGTSATVSGIVVRDQ